MAGYRQIHTKIWKDDWFIELEPVEKLFFVYLFSNDEAEISGIYKLPIRVMQNETGIDRVSIQAMLKKFEDQKKVVYRDGVVWVVNMQRYHQNASPKTQVKVSRTIAFIPECDIKLWYLYYQKTGIYSTDTVSIRDTVNKAKQILNVSINKDEAKGEPQPPDLDDWEPDPSAKVFKAYEQNIGMVSKIVSDQIGGLVDDYTADWVMMAIEEAVKNEARNLAYVEGILKRWKKDGLKSDKRTQSGAVKSTEMTVNGVRVVL